MYHYLSEDTIELSQIDRKRETEAQCQLRYLYVFFCLLFCAKVSYKTYVRKFRSVFEPQLIFLDESSAERIK